MPNTNERYCLHCEKLGHYTSDCWSTHGLNHPADLELSRLTEIDHAMRALAATAPNAGAPLAEAVAEYVRLNDALLSAQAISLGATQEKGISIPIPAAYADEFSAAHRAYERLRALAAAPAQQAGAVEQHYETQPDGTVQVVEPSQRVDPRVPERIKALAEHWAKMAEIDHADAANEAKLQHSMLVDWLASRARADAEGTRQYMRGFDDAKAQQAGAPLPLAPSEPLGWQYEVLTQWDNDPGPVWRTDLYDYKLDASKKYVEGGPTNCGMWRNEVPLGPIAPQATLPASETEGLDRDFDAELQAADDGPPLIGRWHHGDGVLVSGSIRIAQWDCDTNPPTEFRERVLDWVCESLNAALSTRAQPQADAAEPVAKEGEQS